MNQELYNTLCGRLENGFDRVKILLADSQQRIEKAMNKTTAHAVLLRTVAEAWKRERERKIQALLAQLQRAREAHNGHISSLTHIQDQLDKNRHTLDRIEADPSSYDFHPILTIKDSLAELAGQIEATGGSLEATKSAEDSLVAAVEDALPEALDPALHTALLDYWVSCDRSQAAYSAAHSAYRQLNDHCDQVGATVDARATAVSNFKCSMCGDDHSVDDQFIMSTCEHCCCRDCAEGWAKAKLDDGEYPRCIVEGCGKPWTQEDFQLLDETLYHKYCSVEIHKYVSDKQCYKCVHCNMPVERPPADEHMDLHLHCPVCKKQSCLACQVSWHDDVSCEQYQRWKRENEGFDDKAFKQWLKDNKGRVHKTSAGGCGNAALRDNCNSVWCCVCQYYFCWFCLQRIAGPGASSEERHRHFCEPGPCHNKVFDEPTWDDQDVA